MNNRSADQTPAISNIDQDAAAASAQRRTVAARGLAAVAIIALVGLGALLLISTEGDSSLNVADDPETQEVLDDADTATPTPADTPTLDEETEQPLDIDGDSDVPTVGDDVVFQVVAVQSDDTLNVRSGAGTSFDVLFTLEPDATGVVRTDAAPELDGVNEWVEIYGPVAGTRGWVNLSFLDAIEVTNESPCTFNGGTGNEGLILTNAEGSADANGVVLSIVDTYRFGSCIRTVIQAQDGFGNSTDSPADLLTVLPQDISIIRDPNIDFTTVIFGPSVVGAAVAEARFSEALTSQSMFLFRADDASLAGIHYGASRTVDAKFDNTNGTIIIDVADTGDATAAAQPLFDQDSIVIAEADRFEREDGSTHVNVFGFAQAFEANLGVDVLFDDAPLVVDWDGAVLAEPASSNSVLATDWTEALGAFEIDITLEPGIDSDGAVLVLNPESGSDTPMTVEVMLSELFN